MNLHPGCYPGLYSLWGFAPSLLVTMAAAHSAGLFCFWGFAPSLLVTMVALHSAGLFSCSGFAPYCLYYDYYTLHWAVCFWGFAPSFDRNHICRNTRNFLSSLGVLSDTTEFHAFSRHVRIGSCYSVATIKIFVRCIVTGCEVATRIFFNNKRSERNKNPVRGFLLPTSLRGSWRTVRSRGAKMLTKIKR